ncbi:MAG TPA: hypothetical protein VKR32_03100 [Puia sp.]|nr:hypothetical protein [Puia sp.]
MNSNVMPSIVKMEQEELEQLLSTADVKETIATEINLSKNKNRAFGIVDLWNIQRNMRSARKLIKRNLL